jgi:hypothetical protein
MLNPWDRAMCQPHWAGPLRRRREKRQLGQLAEESGREASPSAARAHVKVIDDQPHVVVHIEQEDEEEPEDPSERSLENRPSGFHVRPYRLTSRLRRRKRSAAL